MSGMTATAVGVDLFSSSVDAAGDRLANLEPVNADAGVLVLDEARIPYRTGRLASTVRAIADDHGVDLVAGGAVAPYAPAAHARDPFLTRALATAESAVLDLYTDHVTDVVDSIEGA